MCFWCDDKFTPGHKCIIKRLYSICIVENKEEDEEVEIETVREMDNLEITNPNISMNALEGVLNCFKVIGRVDKLTIFIMIDSYSIHNFMNTWVANK